MREKEASEGENIGRRGNKEEVKDGEDDGGDGWILGQSLSDCCKMTTDTVDFPRMGNAMETASTRALQTPGVMDP